MLTKPLCFLVIPTLAGACAGSFHNMKQQRSVAAATRGCSSKPSSRKKQEQHHIAITSIEVQSICNTRLQLEKWCKKSATLNAAEVRMAAQNSCNTKLELVNLRKNSFLTIQTIWDHPERYKGIVENASQVINTCNAFKKMLQEEIQLLTSEEVPYKGLAKLYKKEKELEQKLVSSQLSCLKKVIYKTLTWRFFKEDKKEEKREIADTIKNLAQDGTYKIDLLKRVFTNIAASSSDDDVEAYALELVEHFEKVAKKLD